MGVAPAIPGRPPFVVFSDLDGTLLDGHDYSPAGAEPALRLLRGRRIPLVLCTSKTRPEVEFWRRALGNHDPFVVENGGAVYVPRGYFGFAFEHDRSDAVYRILELGAPYEAQVAALAELRRHTGVALRGFSDMSAGEIARLCGLTPAAAERAKQREYDEPFLVPDGQAEARVAAAGIPVTKGGRFHHLGAGDKGRAVGRLMALYRRAVPEVSSVGIGDAPNDRPLLAAVDIPILVGRRDGAHDRGARVPGVRYAGAAGPKGWSAAVCSLVRGAAPDGAEAGSAYGRRRFAGGGGR